MADENQNQENEQVAGEAPAGQPDSPTISGEGEPKLPEIAEEPSPGPSVPVDPPSGLGTVIAPDEPNPALDELAEKSDGEDEGGVLDQTPRKADASTAAVAAILADEGDLTHEHLDQIEARQDVSDIRLLTAFLRRHLGSRESQAPSEAS